MIARNFFLLRFVAILPNVDNQFHSFLGHAKTDSSDGAVYEISIGSSRWMAQKAYHPSARYWVWKTDGFQPDSEEEQGLRYEIEIIKLLGELGEDID